MEKNDIEKLMNETLKEMLRAKEVEIKLTLEECSMLATTLNSLLKDNTMLDEIRELLTSIREKVDLDNFDIKSLRDECMSVLAEKVAEELMREEEEDDQKGKASA